MYCPNCSYNNPPALRYCRNCENDLLAVPATRQPYAETNELRYASLGMRMLATLLDILLLILVFTLLLSGVAGFVALTGDEGILRNESLMSGCCWLCGSLAMLYLIAMDSTFGKASLGKRWLNLAVHDAYGMPPGLLRAAWRAFSLLISLPFIPLLLLQPFTPRKQAVHDFLAGTVVVNTGDSNKISVMATLLVMLMTLLIPLLALAATTGKPYFRLYIQQVQLQQGIKSGYAVATALTSYYRQHGHSPATLADTGATVRSPHIEAININPQNGEISISLSATTSREIRGRHILLKPALTADQVIVWACSSPDIESRLIPDSCQATPSALTR